MKIARYLLSPEAFLTWDLVNDVPAGDVKVLLGTADFGFPIPLATLVGATSIAAWRSRLWPTWLSLIGVLGALWIVEVGAGPHLAAVTSCSMARPS
jgi:hypothetical protein